MELEKKSKETTEKAQLLEADEEAKKKKRQAMAHLMQGGEFESHSRKIARKSK